jgi:hypothetical protein
MAGVTWLQVGTRTVRGYKAIEARDPAIEYRSI